MSAARLPRQAPFDLVLADPPYGAGSGTSVAKAVAEAEWLNPGRLAGDRNPRRGIGSKPPPR
jgi:16S rRNA G966 N2-methylase RsmD